MTEPGWFADFVRTILSFLDSAGYTLVSGVYNIFFTVANARIFNGDIINTFFGRIQLIIGIIMIFSLAITALNIIINPDTYKDKQKGAGKIVMRVALALVMLSLVVPIKGIDTSDGNELNEQINNNGILFGFLYQFQNSVMKENVIGKLVLGSNVEGDDATNYGNLNNISDIGGILATTVAKSFISPTLKDTSDDPNISPDGITENDVMCDSAINEFAYQNPNLSYKTLLKNINETCNSDSSGEVYVFQYTPILGLVCSIIMTVIILGFTIDVAVRAIKLALLRIIAPIPIISYVIPGQEKNGAFGNWIKTLTSTYLDLFLRIMVIYFGGYVILIISEGGVNIWQNGPGFFTSLFSTVFIIIGILMFMKQAPKFLQDMLGIKGDGKFFSGIGTMLGAGALIGGIPGSALTNFRASRSEGAGLPRAMLSAATGGLAGLVAGGKTLMNTDKKVPSAVFSELQRRNANRASGVTFLRKASAATTASLTGRAPGARDEKELEYLQAHVDAQKALKSMVDEESLKSQTATGLLSLSNGDQFKLNYTHFNNKLKNAVASGTEYFDETDVNGNLKRIYVNDLDPNVMKTFEESQAAEYLKNQKRLKEGDAGYNAKVHGSIDEAKYASENAKREVDLYDYCAIRGKGIGSTLNDIRKIKTSHRSDVYRANSNAINANKK